jgi:hypothetical protein
MINYKGFGRKRSLYNRRTSRNLTAETEENHEKPKSASLCPYRDSNRVPPKYKSIASPFVQIAHL